MPRWVCWGPGAHRGRVGSAGAATISGPHRAEATKGAADDSVGHLTDSWAPYTDLPHHPQVYNAVSYITSRTLCASVHIYLRRAYSFHQVLRGPKTQGQLGTQTQLPHWPVTPPSHRPSRGLYTGHQTLKTLVPARDASAHILS